MKANNPFTLTFGKQPTKYIYRAENSGDIISTFSAEHPVWQTYLISGIRGSGKTVLMTSVANELLESKEWVVADLNSSRPLLEDLAMRLYDICKKTPDLLKSGFDISIAGFGVGIGETEREQDNVSKIKSCLEILGKKGKKLLITVDEVSNSADMRLFASQFQIFVRQNYPIFLIMTGLYDNITAIQNDPALTFLLRSPRIFLEPLSLMQITVQYKEIFSLDIESAKKLAATTRGYAFAFQAFGMLYFEYRESLSSDEILYRFDAILDDYVYRKIWNGMSDQDKKIALYLAQNGTSQTKDICEGIGMDMKVFSKYRERLINKGVVTSPQWGKLELALPRFGEIVTIYTD